MRFFAVTPSTSTACHLSLHGGRSFSSDITAQAYAHPSFRTERSGVRSPSSPFIANLGPTRPTKRDSSPALGMTALRLGLTVATTGLAWENPLRWKRHFTSIFWLENRACSTLV